MPASATAIAKLAAAGMTTLRAFKRVACCALMGLMLFAQLAIAAYACPALSAPAAQAPCGDDMAAMRTDASGDRLPAFGQMAGQLDDAAPNLCAEHCRFGQQSDQARVPAAPAVVLISLYVVTPTLPEALQPMAAAAASSMDARAAASPPHAIVHCCLRT